MKTQTVKLTGRIERAIDEVDKAAAGGQSTLTLDFAQAEFVSVEALEWLEELLLRTQSQKSIVTFTNVPPTIYKVFKVARINSLLEACGSLPLSGPAC